MRSVASGEILVRVQNLTKYFPIRRGIIFERQVGAVQAVDDVSFDIRRGETLGLVGESGCGKSTTGRTMLMLYPATGGRVLFGEQDIFRAKGRAPTVPHVGKNPPQSVRHHSVTLQSPAASPARSPSLRPVRLPIYNTSNNSVRVPLRKSYQAQ